MGMKQSRRRVRRAFLLLAYIVGRIALLTQTAIEYWLQSQKCFATRRAVHPGNSLPQVDAVMMGMKQSRRRVRRTFWVLGAGQDCRSHAIFRTSVHRILATKPKGSIATVQAHCHCAGAGHVSMPEAVEGWRPYFRRACSL